MVSQPAPRKNHLLAALPPAEWALWQPELEAVSMPLGQVLSESGIAITHVYFPTTYECYAVVRKEYERLLSLHTLP